MFILTITLLSVTCTAVEVGEERLVTVLTAPSGFEDAPIQLIAITPEGREVFLPTRKVPGGYEAMFNPVHTGPHKVHVDIAGREIPKSPKLVNVEDKLDVKKLQVKGLETRKLTEPCFAFVSMSLCFISSYHVRTLYYVQNISSLIRHVYDSY